MKLLMLAFNRVNQGTYWRALRFGQALCRRGHAVTLIATSRDRRSGIVVREEQGVEIVETPDLFSGSLRSGWDPWNTLQRLGWLRGRSYDLVHAFESRPTVIFPALAAHRRGAALVMDWADWFGKGGSVEERPNPIVRNALRPVETFFEEHYRTRADGTTVICSTLRDKALALGVREDTILCLRNGADTERLSVLPLGESRDVLGLPLSIPVIGYVGTIFRQDAQLLVSAFERVLKQLPEARLVVAGYCPFDVRAAISRPENVIQTGFVDNQRLNQALAACDLFWLPLCDSNANRGRFPYKLTDYMALGRPVVATAVGDIPQIFAGNEFGLLSPDQPEPFAERTLELLGAPHRMAEMGHLGRELAETRFSWETLTDELEGFYRRIHPNS